MKTNSQRYQPRSLQSYRILSYILLLALTHHGFRASAFVQSFVAANSHSEATSLSSRSDDFPTEDNNSEEETRHYQINVDEVPLSQTFQKGVVLQRAGDREGALDAYNEFLKAAQSHDVDPSLYAEVYANMGAVYAMKGKGSVRPNDQVRIDYRTKAKDAFTEAVKYRPGLGSAWVNLALLTLAEGKEMGGGEQSKVVSALKEARSCCVRALGMDNEDERSRSLANKLVIDIDAMIKQSGST
ncbi:predicted protein [Thalassiosira pseudonana CCMP1335]|uniref:Uncharacterized protein n=1 Tax=Thalassiosira pseudonana TaxID=35128 RepID=B8C2N0_THAPS|nr:predicted protein [Thalassiosira pseudonana CCMP1335]EED91975.1 predicted protein [Thalassiosira pseudonana CCMP1335]|eukprot:g13983.t1 g13983   contig9:891440-892232(+)